MADINKRIKGLRIIPVVDLNDVEKAQSLAIALCNGGLPIVELLFNENVPNIISKIKEACPSFLVGVGNVKTSDDADLVKKAGADFISGDIENLDYQTWTIDEADLENIEELARNKVNEMLDITLKHLGVNEEDEEGSEVANKFARIFVGKTRQTSKGWFGSEAVEIMSKNKRMGKYGHIGIGVNNPNKAREYYEALGYTFDESTAGYDDKGNLKIVYFNGEINGFAIHIVKN